MVDRYFDKFPIIRYSNTSAVDITRRTAMLKSVASNPYVYYPYDIDVYERADQFSARYYNDQFKSWILYLTNDIMDPLREWYMQIHELNEFVTKKYGSMEAATQKVKFYRHSYVGVEDLTIAGFDSLPTVSQAYWEPVFTGSKLTSYRRRPIDWTVNTNRIVQYTLTSANAFSVDEIVDISIDVATRGRGQILKINADDSIYVQHVSGSYIESGSHPLTANSSVYGRDSAATVSFASSNGVYTSSVVIAENLDSTEETYWSPVTYYDYENERNEYNKTLRILDKTLAPVMTGNLKTLLKV
jgi:hypothetical protein